MPLSARSRVGAVDATASSQVNVPRHLAIFEPMKKQLLWSEFTQSASRRARGEGSTTSTQPKPPPKTVATTRASPRGGAKTKNASSSPRSAVPDDWPSRVTRALAQAIKSSHVRVRDVFDRFDTDQSGELDAEEFEAALRTLHVLGGVPEDEQAHVVSAVFDLIDADGNGRLDFDEVEKYLRPHLRQPHAHPKPPPAPVAESAPESPTHQKHRLRRKEEWEALERFDNLLDLNGDGVLTKQEAHSMLLLEGYDHELITALLTKLDVNHDGVIDREEWRRGMSLLPPALLIALTNPADGPPGNEAVFGDLLKPTLVARASGYHRKRLTSIAVACEEVVTIGKASRGCTIAQPEKRATTLSQLRTLVAHIRRRCESERWVGDGDSLLTSALVSIYDAMAYVVKPATRERQCSYVELVADGAQPPAWFASQWWGTSLEDTLECLEQHARDRRLEPSLGASYWSAAFALSTWVADETLRVTSHPADSCFGRAMALSAGVVGIVDRAGVCFSRTWVLYESGAALRMRDAQRHFEYDLYTPQAHQLSGMLVKRGGGDDGPPAHDAFIPATSVAQFVHSSAPSASGGEMKRQEAGVASSEARLWTHERSAVGLLDPRTTSDVKYDPSRVSKAVREDPFPPISLRIALNAEVADSDVLHGGLRSPGTASNDRKRLLNALAGAADAETAPVAKHASYGEFNAMVRGFVGSLCLVHAMSEGGWLLHAVLQALSAAPLIRSLSVPAEEELGDISRDVLRERYRQLLETLPGALNHLAMRVPREVSIQEGLLGRLHALTKLDLSGSIGLAALPDDVTALGELIEIDCTGCVSLAAVTSHVYDLPRLEVLVLSGCVSLTSVSAYGAKQSSLRTLLLDGCVGITQLPELLGSKLGGLEVLSIDGCDELEKVPRWVERKESLGMAVNRPDHLDAA